MGFQWIICRGGFPEYSGWLLMLLALLLSTSSFSGDLSRVEELVSGADMVYWMGMEEGGDTGLFREGLRRLEEAAELVESIPEEERGNLPERIESLRVELDEQLEMAHDTLNGTLPLFRYITGRGALNEWFDDPWIMGAVRGAYALSGTAAQHWKPLPQLDVVYGSSVRHFDDETVLEQPSFHPALENEMAFVFNLDSRFFNHNRIEVRGAMDEMQWRRYQAAGMDDEHARILANALSLDQVLEVRLQELHVEDPLWFYQLSGRLRDGLSGSSEGTVFAFGMVRDCRARLPWLPLVVFLPCLVAMLAASACRYRVTTPVAAFLSGGGLAIPLLWILSPRLARGEALLVAHWWAPFGVALGLLIVVPILFVLACRRVSIVEQWFLCTVGRRHASAFGIAAVPAAIVGFAALSCLPAAEAAVWLALLAWLAFVPLSVMLFEWAGSEAKDPTRERVLALVAVAWFGVVWWLLPESDRSFGVDATLAIIVGSGLVATLLAGRGGFVAVLLLSAGGAFGAALTGEALLLLPWSLAGAWVLSALPSRSRRAGSPAASESRHGTGEEGNWPDSEWPYFSPQDIAPAEQILLDFAGAEESASGRHLHVEGGEGAGKSRVIAELLRDDRLNGSIFVIFCSREKDGFPFAFLVRGFARAGEQVPSWLSGDSRLAIFDQVAGSAAGILPGADVISGLMPEDEGEKLSPEHVASWVASFFEERSKETGSSCLLWIDDAGDLSEDEREFVGALLDQAKIRETRLMLITSSRTGSTVEGLRLEGAVVVHLDWDGEELGRCLESTLARGCVDAMMEKTSIRVPGFFIDWAEELVERKILERRRGGWSLTGRDVADDLSAPETILENAGTVLKDIDGDCLDLLRVAACDGTTFHAGCVAQSAGRSIGEAVLMLERCEDRGIVVDLPEDRWFRFRDDLVREFLWTKTRREGQSSHRQRYAMALEEMASCYQKLPDDEMSGFERLVRSAGHYESAGTASEEAVRCRLKLVREALDRQLFAMAVQNAEALLEILGKRRGMSAPIVEAGTLYLRALSLRGRNPASRGATGKALFNRLRALCGESGLPSSTRAALACEVARTLWSADNQGDSPREENLCQALAILEDFDANTLEDPSLRIRLWHYRGRSIHLCAGEDEARLRTADEIFCKALRIEASSSAAKRDRAEALNSRANCLVTLIDLMKERAIHDRDDVIELLDESIALKRDLGDRLGEAMSLGAKGRFFLYHPSSSREDLEEALSCFEKNESISREAGNIRGEIMMPSLQGECLLRLERYEESIREYRRALKVAENIEEPDSIAWARLGLVNALKGSGAELTVVEGEMQALALAAKNCEDPYFRRKWRDLESS